MPVAVAVKPARQEGQTAECQRQRSPYSVMKLLLREAVYGSARGHADVDFIHSVRRLQLADVDTGDKYASVKFVGLSEQVASRYLSESDGQAINELLPTLGVRSPVSVTFDPVTLGNGMFSRHETLQVVMLRHLTKDGTISIKLIDARSIGMFHDGQSQAASIARALEEHPAHLTLAALRSRMVSVISGDGAVAAGGPQAKHSSSKTCELIWKLLYPEAGLSTSWTVWDPFHRAHCAFAAALSKMSIVQELYSLGRSMSANFGVHSGRVLFRSLAEELNEPLYAVDSGSGARKVYQLSRVAENLLQNFRLYMAGLHSKIQLKRSGHGLQSQSALVAVARRLGSVEIVGFMLLFADTMRLRIQPFVSLTEREADPPWIAQRCFQKMMHGLKEDLGKLSAVRRLVFISCLLNLGRDSVDAFNMLYSVFGDIHAQNLKFSQQTFVLLGMTW